MGYEVNRTSFLGQGLNPSAVGATDSSIAVQQSTQSSKSEFHPHPETLSKSARHQQIDHHMNLLHGIRKGKQAVSASGIAPTHVSNMAVMAKTYDVFLLVRPVNSLSTSLIEEGSAIGKALDVKAKTSDWGAWAGFIPNLQLFSKKYAQHSDKSNLLPFFTSPKTINNVSYLPKPLSLTQNRLMFLLQQDLIQIDSDSQDDGISLFTVKSPKGASENPNDLFSFRLRQNDLNGYTVEFKIQNQAQANWLPFEVIAEAEGDNPSVERATYLTADYDVYGVFPNFQQLAAQKENQTEIESFKESVSLYQENKGTEHGRAAARGLIRNTLNAARQVFLDQKNRAIVDPILGRITQFEKTFLSNLDASFGLEKGKLIRHGTEQNNWSYPEYDPEIFVVTPSGNTYMTSDLYQTGAVFNIAKNSNYVAYNNRSYENESDGEQLHPVSSQQQRNSFTRSSITQSLLDKN